MYTLPISTAFLGTGNQRTLSDRPIDRSLRSATDGVSGAGVGGGGDVEQNGGRFTSEALDVSAMSAYERLLAFAKTVSLSYYATLSSPASPSLYSFGSPRSQGRGRGAAKSSGDREDILLVPSSMLEDVISEVSPLLVLASSSRSVHAFYGSSVLAQY